MQNIDTLIRELVEADPSLKGRESTLRELLSELLAGKPDAIMDPAFKARLKHQLAAAGVLARPRLAPGRRMRLYYGLGAAALLVVLLVAARPSEPTQVAFKASDESVGAPAAPEAGDMKMMSANREAATRMELTTTAFENGYPIPVQYTCDGSNTVPSLAWSGLPEGTKSLALFVEDQDSPGERFVHWLVFDIDPASFDLARSTNGRNSTGKTGYVGPCPPSGSGHRYLFELWAVDTTLGLKDGSVDSVGLWEAMKGHVLGSAVLEGTYGHK